MEEFDILCKIYKCKTMKYLEFYKNNSVFANIARAQCSSDEYKECPWYHEPLVFVKKIKDRKEKANFKSLYFLKR